MSFPQRHPLCGPGANTSYDYTLGLEQPGGRSSSSVRRWPRCSARDTANIGFGGMRPATREQAAAGGRGGRGGGAPAGRTVDLDAEASLPLIIEEVRGR